MQASRPRPTLDDVARMAGVSIATASRVLGGSRDRVSSVLTERVERAAADLDYHPNPHARALVRASSATVAVIIHDLTDPYFSEIARGALRAAGEEQRLVMICASFRDPDREVAYVSEMRAQRIHAVVLAGGSTRGLESGGRLADELEAYRSDGGRVAVMVAGHGYPAAVPDHREGGASAGRHLVELGHRNMGVVAGPGHLVSVEDRLAGFESVLAEAGLPMPEVVHADFSRAGGRTAAAEMIDRRPNLTAILALNDPMAAGAVKAMEALGRRVPDDVSVVGFDDAPLAGDFHPPLTTVRIPMEEIGAEAMRLALTSEPGAPDDRVTVFATELVVRESTGPPPA